MVDKNQRNQHNYNLDIIKIFSCFGVVYLHIADGYLLRSDYFASGWLWFLLFVLRVISGLSVPLFFMVSGYLTIGKNYPTDKLFGRIAVRLLVPFLFLYLLFLITSGASAIALYFTPLRTELPVPFALVSAFFTADGGLHFLVAMIGLNLLLPVWSLIFQQKQRHYALAKYVIILEFLASIVITVQQLFNPLVDGVILNGWRWLLWVGYFLLGYLLRVQPNLINKRVALVLTSVGLLLTTVICFLTRQQLLAHPDNQLISAAADWGLHYFAPWVIFTSVGIFSLTTKLKLGFLKNKCWQYVVKLISSLSLGVYIWHGAVYSYLDVFRRIGLDNMIFWHRPALALLGITFLVIAISAFLTVVCGSLKYTRLLMGWDDYWPYLPKVLTMDVKQLFRAKSTKNIAS